MSKTLYLDPVKTAELEPSEGDERNASWISPFEIPRAILVHCETDFRDIRAITFKYIGSEKGTEWAELDARVDPPVHVRNGQFSHKIMELTFGHPISLKELSSLGARLKAKSRMFNVGATRFNYQMIGSIFEDWDDAVEPMKAP